ncbi:MAG: PhzF family phenazine biosynthesis isomerase [Bacteroidota bacterium]
MQLYHIDAFTDAAFSGNPATVCFLPTMREDTWLQQMAEEINHPATAFVAPAPKKGYHIRWYSPKAEIGLCGHASLATAHALFFHGHESPESEVILFPRKGQLTLKAVQEGQYEMNFPAILCEATTIPATLEKALGEKVLASAKHPGGYWILELENEAAVQNLHPNRNALVSVGKHSFIATSQAMANSPFDIVSRVMVTYTGYHEDQVTGSAHCCLAPYWTVKLAKTTLEAFQASARGGRMQLELAGDRVLVRGKAVTLSEMEGT